LVDIGVEVEGAEVEEEVALEAVPGAVAVGALDEGLDDAVHAFAVGVGKAVKEEGQDPVKVALEPAGDFPDGSELAPHGVAVPLAEEGAGLGQDDNYPIPGPTPWPPHEKFVPEGSCSRGDMLVFCDHVADAVPAYLEAMEPEAPCWPSWYDQNQAEFHLNNLRHIRHHVGQLIERHQHIGGLASPWVGVG